jgi:hypothetical protein
MKGRIALAGSPSGSADFDHPFVPVLGELLVTASGLEPPRTALTRPAPKFYRHFDGSLLGDQKGMRCGEIAPMPRLPRKL